MPKTLRLIALLLLALWWGGFTFYAGRVVPIGNQVLHSKLRQGAITQQVTGELNVLALVAFALVAIYLIFDRPFRRVWVHWTLWLIGLASTIALVIVRAKLNVMFDPTAREIANEPVFFHLHEVYLTIATVQWCAATALLICFLNCNKFTAKAELTLDESVKI